MKHQLPIEIDSGAIQRLRSELEAFRSCGDSNASSSGGGTAIQGTMLRLCNKGLSCRSVGNVIGEIAPRLTLM
jgi:hypothetical protein